MKLIYKLLISICSAGILLFSYLYLFYGKISPIERNKIVLADSLKSVEIAISEMNKFIKYLPMPTQQDMPHNYYFEDSVLFVNGLQVGTYRKVELKNLMKVLELDSISSLKFYRVAKFLLKNQIYAQITCSTCPYTLYEYRPTLEQDRGDSRYIILNDINDQEDAIRARGDTILDKKGNLALIADRTNPIYPTENNFSKLLRFLK
ncbi:hypothetical protein [Dyadobacter sp. 32]|uniref:hypothetical protein n=1 Tax=Dyadobacter sp. 32 TaxID=538966 RepID=UPI0011EE3C49